MSHENGEGTHGDSGKIVTNKELEKLRAARDVGRVRPVIDLNSRRPGSTQPDNLVKLIPLEGARVPINTTPLHVDSGLWALSNIKRTQLTLARRELLEALRTKFPDPKNALLEVRAVADRLRQQEPDNILRNFMNADQRLWMDHPEALLAYAVLFDEWEGSTHS